MDLNIFNEFTKAWGEVVSTGMVFLGKVVVLGWTLEKLIGFVSKLTPWKWDDNLGALLGGLLAKFGKK